MPKIKVFSDIYKLYRAAGEFIAHNALRSIEEEEVFHFVLSGGNTPESVYGLLTNAPYDTRIDWQHVQLYWGDERCVPPDHIDSNYNMAKLAMIDHVPIPKENVHRIPAERNPDEAASEYEAVLHEVFGIQDAQLPRFDVVMLGLGADGHTASLFPYSSALDEEGAWVISNYVEKLRAWRITMTPPIINNAKHVIFLVSGAEKASAVRDVIEGEYDPQRLPAQLIKPTEGELIWLLDEDAAQELEDN